MIQQQEFKQQQFERNKNWHPQSILYAQSQVTLDNLKSSMTDQSQLDQALRRYSIDDRKYLIVDRINGQIIDSRNEEVVQGLFRRAFKKQEQMFDQVDLANQSNQKTTIQNHWDQHWEQSDKLHQMLLSAVCTNDVNKFVSLTNKKQSPLPININYKSLDNWTPIHFASMNGNLEILKLIIKQKNLKINALTSMGRNALHIAAHSNKKDACKILIDNGIDVNYQDQDLNSPLHIATQMGHKEVIKILLLAGADYTLLNHKAKTPRQLCKSRDVLNLYPKEEKQEQHDMQQQGIFSSIFKNRKIQYVQKLLTGENRYFKQFDRQKNSGDSSGKNQLKENPVKNIQFADRNSGQVSKEQNSHQKKRQKNIAKMYQLLKQNKPSEIISLNSFKFFKKIGEGAFGEVYVVRKGNKQKLYALKAIKKQKVLKTNLYRYIQTEKQVLSLINHPFIVKLAYAFQTETYLFLVMDYCQGGDLGKLLQRKRKLDEKTTKFYACQIILALQALHQNMIIYRDLKPENIVLDSEGHALLTDFGLSKKTTDLDAINKSFCGTPAYLPLQIIQKRGHTRMADWYQFGIVLYEMMIGIPPFYADNRTELYQNVKNGIIKFPRSTPQPFRDLIRKLLHQDYEKRLGAQNDANSVKEHPWFKDIDWTAVSERRLQVPPIQKKILIGTQPIRCKFQDIKSQKYHVPTWSFINRT